MACFSKKYLYLEPKRWLLYEVNQMIDPQKTLSDVPEPQLAFWFNNGTVTKNIYEFANALESCDDGTFKHHVADGKSDFCNWISAVLGDEELASKLKQETSKKKYALRVKKRIAELEKLKNSPKNKPVKR
jgi:hypothetical protein